MNIIAVDDEPLALKDLARMLKEAAPSCDPHPFNTSRAALDYARAEKVDAAFLDIEMPGRNGLALAKGIKDAWPDAHIVFVTSYERYALDAFALHATGYLLKPVRIEELRRELTFVYAHAPRTDERKPFVRTFGGFEVLVDGDPLVFRRAKAKELLALLVDRRGCGMSMREACAALWEDEPHSLTQKSYYQTVVASLRSTLEAAGVGSLLVKSWNSLAVDPDAFDCDSYRFMDGDPLAVNAYRGDYLPSYSWAEFSTGMLRDGRSLPFTG